MLFSSYRYKILLWMLFWVKWVNENENEIFEYLKRFSNPWNFSKKINLWILIFYFIIIFRAYDKIKL
jgi:hypothetical protein